METALVMMFAAAAVMLTAINPFGRTGSAGRHQRGLPVATIQARLSRERARTFVPLRGW
ncbi:hypothetical protein [Nocardia sp. NBC_01327]|uniref:hypothetical protein n=1 Tax=Nocardia sp. NBC_01327 TaxID=2903593 RepID=UPI002E13695A|nr:hypothetical protein OG326_01470 [Nocardia sp. NBC_01327]